MNKNQKTKIRKKFNLRRGDTVQIMTGKEKGAVGKIISFDRKKEKVIIEGLNMVKKHIKASQANPQGGIISKEAPIHYSNVLLYCKESKKGERIRIKQNEDGSKTRIFVKSGTEAD